MPTSLLAIAALTLHLAGIAAALHALMRTRTAPGAVAWVLGLVLLPYVTLVPYLFLGRSHFAGYIELHRSRQPPVGAGAAAAPTDSAGSRLAAVTGMLDTTFRHGQRLRLLVNGEATFAAILDAIATAKHFVLVQFFVIHDDAIGRQLARALTERAAAGVAVCVLYDGIGSHDLPRHYVDALREAGVAIHPFVTRGWVNRLQVNFRNHRKVVVVDGRIGFVGGHNVGDEYLGRKPPLSPWRDTHLAIEGPAVADLQHSFAEDWRWVTGVDPPSSPPPAGDGTAATLIVATGPADRQETCSLYFVAVIGAAQRRVWLTTPYFVPDNSVASALRLAVFRGVDVRVLLPARPDHRVVFLSSTLHAHDAIGAGIRVFRYQPGFMHQKVLLVDDDIAAVGSMNFDSRSLRLNFEIGALNVDRAFAQDVAAMLAADFAQSREVDLSEYRDAPLRRRVLMHVARLFDPVL